MHWRFYEVNISKLKHQPIKKHLRGKVIEVHLFQMHFGATVCVPHKFNKVNNKKSLESTWRAMKTGLFKNEQNEGRYEEITNVLIWHTLQL